MAHLDGIGAGIYSRFSMSAAAVTTTAYQTAANTTASNIQPYTALYGLMGTPQFVSQMREIPSVGVPANIVNVPAYGQGQSSQIQGQSDAPSLEFSINYNPSDASHIALSDRAGDGSQYVFKLDLLYGDQGTSTLVAADRFSTFFWIGQVGSFLITPNLTDSNQASFSTTIVGAFEGPLTLTTS